MWGFGASSQLGAALSAPGCTLTVLKLTSSKVRDDGAKVLGAALWRNNTLAR
jgi:hypothetical protein